MKPIIPALPHWLKPPPRGEGRGFYWFLLGVIVLIVLFLIGAEKPWNERLMRLTARRDAAGKPWKVEQFVVYYEWFEALLNLVLAGALFATLRLWAKPLTGNKSKQGTPLAMPGKRWLIIGLSVAVLLGSCFRIQRLDHSFWSDEEYTFRTHIWGEMEEQEDGTLAHRSLPWRTTVFRNKANNHIGFTVPARLLHNAVIGDGKPVNEPILRLLPFLAGLASIALIGSLVAAHAGATAGIAVALLWAIIPWHLQHSTEARGYSEMLLFLILSFVFLNRALRQYRWRDWLAFGAAELAVMLSYPGAVYVLIIANTIAIGCLWWRLRGDENRAKIIGRLIITNVMAGMIFLQIFAPSIPQIKHYLANGPLHGHMTIDWFMHVWVHCSSGLTLHNPWPAEHIGSSFLSESERIPGFWIFHIPVMLGFVAIGIVGAAKRYRWLLLPGLACILGVVLSYVHNSLSGTMIWTGYVVFILIGFCIFSVLGVTTLVAIATSDKTRRLQFGIPALAIFLSLYAIMSTTARTDLCHKPTQPIRQAVMLARGESPAYSDDDGGLITASFGTSRGMIISYDPRSRIIKNVDALNQLITDTRDAHKHLRIYFCGRRVAELYDPDDAQILKVVENPEIFRLVGNVLARRELFSYHVYELLDPPQSGHAESAKSAKPNVHATSTPEDTTGS